MFCVFRELGISLSGWGRHVAAAAVCIGLAGIAGPSLGQDIEFEDPNFEPPIPENESPVDAALAWGGNGGTLFALGTEVVLNENVAAPFRAVSGDLEISGEVLGDVIAMAENIAVYSPVAGRTTTFARNVKIVAPIEGDLNVAARHIAVRRAASIGGNASITGKMVEVVGEISGDLEVSSGGVKLDGFVGGDLDVDARWNLVIGPNARIMGDVNYRSPYEAVIDPAAVIAGEVNFTETPREDFPPTVSLTPHFGIWSGLVWGSVVFVTAALMGLLFPQLYAHSIRFAREFPLRSVFAGIATLLIGPVLGVVLLLTLFGAGAGAGLLTGVAALAVLGAPAAAYIVGHVALDRTSQFRRPQVLFLLAGVAALVLTSYIPIVGQGIVLGIVIQAIGSTVMGATGLLRHGDPTV